MKQFWYFFAIQFLSYGVVAWNFRAVALGWYVSIGVTDALASIISFTLVKKIVAADSRLGMIGYACGGTCGSLLSVWLTKKVFGQ